MFQQTNCEWISTHHRNMAAVLSVCWHLLTWLLVWNDFLSTPQWHRHDPLHTVSVTHITDTWLVLPHYHTLNCHAQNDYNLDIYTPHCVDNDMSFDYSNHQMTVNTPQRGCQDSMVDTVPRIMDGWPVVKIAPDARDFCLPQTSRPISRLNQPHTQWVPHILSSWVRWSLHIVDHLLPFSAKVKNVWS